MLAWRRYAHVQLSAWTSSTEKTVIAAADAPEALPELSNEASSGAASKGFQQITGWQVQHHLVAVHLATALSGSQLFGSCSADRQTADVDRFD